MAARAECTSLPKMLRGRFYRSSGTSYARADRVISEKLLEGRFYRSSGVYAARADHANSEILGFQFEFQLDIQSFNLSFTTQNQVSQGFYHQIKVLNHTTNQSQPSLHL